MNISFNERIVEKIISGFKDRIPSIVSNLFDRFVDRSLNEENFSVNRLKQIQDNLKEKVFENSEGAIAFESARDRQHGVVHWCGNGDRFLTQDIRNQDQLGGTQQLFEIDPMKNLPLD